MRYDQPGAVRVGAVLLLILFFHVLHRAAAGFGRADKHGVVTALRADMLHFGVLACAFAGADDRDGTAAIGTGVRLTDGHHFDVRILGGHFLKHYVFALAAGHGHGVARLQSFRQRLGHDVLQVQRGLRIFRFLCCAGCAGQANSDCQGDRQFRNEAELIEDVVSRFHHCSLLCFSRLFLFQRTTCSQIHRSFTFTCFIRPTPVDPAATPRNRGRDSGLGGDIGHARFGWAKPMGGCHLCSSAHARDLATFLGTLFTGLGAAPAMVVVVLSTFHGAGIARLGAKCAKPVGELRAAAEESDAGQAKLRTIAARLGARGHCAVANTGIAAMFALLRTFEARIDTSFHVLVSHSDNLFLPAKQANVTCPGCRDRHRPRVTPESRRKKSRRSRTP